MKNKNTILKIVCFLILLIGFSGCVNYVDYSVFLNTYNIYYNIISPTYVFEYDGNVEEGYSEIKKEIFRNELPTFFHDDRYSAVLATNTRKLFQDEYYHPTLFFEKLLTSIPTNINLNSQEGNLIFLFTNLGSDKTKIELYTKTFVELKIQIKTPTDEVKTEVETITPTEHPFLQKHVDIISKIPNMKLVYIPPEPDSKELHYWQPTSRDKAFVLPDQEEEQSEPRGNSVIIASLVILSSILVYLLLGGTI
jgi:hypothetical protein